MTMFSQTGVSVFIVIGVFLFSGCAGKAQKETFLQAYKNDRFKEAADIERTSDEAVDQLDAASAFRCAGEYNLSNTLFNSAETYFKEDDTKSLASSSADMVGTLFINSASMGYERNVYEGIMVNTYKALNYMALQDNVSARVEFNRVLERQRRAKVYFQEEIAQQAKEIANAQQNIRVESQPDMPPPQSLQSVAQNRQTHEAIARHYSNLNAFKPYPDFVNPFSTYMAALFFLKEKDYKKSLDLFKEVHGMVQHNGVVKEDLTLMLETLFGTKKANSQRYAWVIIEDGLGMRKKQESFSIPLFIFTDRVYYTSIALPKLYANQVASRYYDVRDSNGSMRAEEIASMDRIIQTEFKTRFNSMVTMAVASAAVKTFVQYQAIEQFGTWAGIASMIYQIATTKADIRMWVALPKRFLIARLKLQGSDVEVTDERGLVIVKAKPQYNKNMILYIKKISKESKALYEVYNF